MANKFRRYTAKDVTADTVVHTAIVDTEVTIIGMTVANVGISEASVSITLNDVYMLKGAPVPTGGAMTPIGGEQKVVMEAGDTISVASDIAVDIIISVLEKS